MPDTSPRGDEVADDAGYDLGKGAGFYLSATEQPWASHYRMYDYIADELPALIQGEFAVSNRCAISGHSMGGHGALIMALKIGRYTSVSAFAPIVNPTRYRGGRKPLRTIWAMTHNAGRSGTAVPDAGEPAGNAIPTLVDQGDADQFGRTATARRAG